MTKVDRALEFALRVHGDQKYAKQFPYHVHLQQVVDVLIEHGLQDPVLYVIAYLHDTIEDCNVNEQDIMHEFGHDVAAAVQGLTNESGKNRRERNAKTYPKIRSNLQSLIVKIADRIANGRFAKQQGSMFDMYQKEYSGFRGALYTDTPELQSLWKTADELFF